MADEIASIWINTQLDLKGVYRDLDNLGKAKTPTLKIGVDVNDYRLTELNKHLDKKVSHLKDTQRYFDSNPLRVRVDDSALSNLNSKLSELSNNTNIVNIGVEAESVYKEVLNIRKLIEAQSFKASVRLDSDDIGKQFDEALKSKTSANVKVTLKEGTTVKGDYRELIVATRQVKDAVRANKPAGGIVQGIQLGIGQSIASGINKTLKSSVGFSIPNLGKEMVERFTKPYNFLIKNNEELQKYFVEVKNSADKKTRDFLRSIGEAYATAVEAELPGEDVGLFSKSRVNVFTRAVAANLDLIKKEAVSATDNVENSDIKTVLTNNFKKGYKTFIANPEEFLKVSEIKAGFVEIGLKMFNPKILNSIFEPIAEKFVEEYRIPILKEHSIPQVQKRTQDILNGKRLSGQKAETVKNVTKDTDTLFLVTGGYAGVKGASANMIAKQIRELNIPNTATNAVYGRDTDINMQLGTTASLAGLSKTNAKGYNQDSIEMAAQALVAIQKNPEIKIKLIGESGGGYTVAETKKILDLMGHGKNVDYIGVGTAELIGGLDKNTGKKLLSTDEYVGKHTKGLYNTIGLAPLNTLPQQNILGVRDHESKHYLNVDVPEYANTLYGEPKEVPQKRVKRLRDDVDYYKKGIDSKEFKKSDYASYSNYLSRNVNEIKRYINIADASIKEELQILLNETEELRKKLYPEDYNFTELKRQADNNIRLLEDIKQSGNIDFTKMFPAVKELESIKKELENKYQALTGTPEAKKNDLISEINKATSTAFQIPIISKVKPEIVTEELKQAEVNIAKVENNLDDSLKDITDKVANFREAYQLIKAATTGKNQNKDYAAVTAKTALENIDRAKLDVENKRSELGIPKIGTPEAQQINELKRQLTQTQSNIKRQLTKAKIELPPLNIKTELLPDLSNLKNVGKNINQGIAVGINNDKSPEIAIEIKAENVIEEAKKAFEIESPSKVFEQIGKYVVEGFSKGLQQFKGMKFPDIVTDLKSKFAELIVSGAKLGTLFLGFTKGLPMLADFATKSSQVAIEMEQINRKLVFAAGGGSVGEKTAQKIRKSATDLKLNVKDSLNTASEFISAVDGTSLGGETGVDVYQNFQKYFAARGGTQDQQNRANLQLEQMAAIGQIQYVDLKPLSQAVPGIQNVLARSQGIDSGELRKRLTTGGGLGNDALIKFSQQAAIEGQSGLAGALDTITASTTNLDNSILKLQENFGNIFNQGNKISLDLTANALNVISDNANNIINVLQVLTIILSKPIWSTGFNILKDSITNSNGALKELSKEFILNFRIQQLQLGTFGALKATGTQAFSAIANMVKGATMALLPFIGQFLAIEAVIVLVDQLGKAFSDLSGEIGKTAVANAKSFKAYQDSLNSVTTSPGANLTDNNFERGRRNWQRDYNPLDTSYKESQDKQKRIGEIINTSQLTLGTTKNQSVNIAISQVNQLDKTLENVQNKRNALIQINPEDKQGVKQLTEQQSELVKQRYELIKPVTGLQAQISERIEALKQSQKTLDNLRDADNISKTAYVTDSASISGQLKGLEEQQDRITKAVGKTTSAYGYLKKALEQLTVNLENVKQIEENRQVATKTSLANNLNLTSGNRQFLSGTSDYQSLQRQAGNVQQNVNQQRTLLSQDSAKSILNAYNVKDNTGIGTLKQIADQAQSEQTKFIINQQIQYQQSKQELNQLQLQIAESRLALFNQLKEQTKQVADYYKGIAHQAELQTIEFKKLSNQINTTNQQNRLREALTNGYDNIVTQFVDGLIESMGQINSISDRTLETQSQLINNRNQFQDSLQSGLELKRSLPGSVPTIPVELDLSGIANNENVHDLQQQLSDATINSTNLDDTLNSVTDNFNKAVDNASQLTNNIDNTTDSTTETFKQLNNVTLGIDSSNDAVKNLNAEFGVSNTHLSNAISNTGQWTQSLSPLENVLVWVQNAFKNVADTISGLINQTTAWLSSLGQVGTILSTGINKITSQPVGDTLNQAGTGFVQNAKELFKQALGSVGKTEIYDSSTGERLYNFNNSSVHHKNSRAKYPDRTYKTIDGRNEEIVTGADTGGRDLVKRDVVLKRNGSDAVPVPSPAAGYAKVIASLGQVQIYDRQLGGQLIGEVMHMRSTNVKTGDLVQYGQPLGIQGGKGGYPVHLHVASTPALLKNYLNDVATGNFTSPTNPGQQMIQGMSNQPSQNMVDTRNSLSSQVIKPRGLTPLGQKYAGLAQNPRVKAALEAIAIAEVGDTLVKKGGGYGKQIGGNYGRDDFANPAALTSIPASLPGRGGQNAFGRYQIHQQDFNWAKDVLGVKNLSPQNQDIIGVQRLAYRGAIEPLLKGDMATFLKKAGNEFASLQGSKYANDGLNATTEGGKSNVFARNFNNALSRFNQPISIQNATIRNQANPITVQNAAIRGQASPISQLKPTVDAGTNIQRQQYQRQQQLEQEREKADVTRQQQEYARNQERLLRQFNRGSRDLEDSRRSGRQQVTDLAASVNKNPTRQQSFAVESTSIGRQYDSAILERERTVKETQERIKSAQQALSTGEVTGDAATALNKQLTADKKAVNELGNEIARLKTLRKDAADAAYKLSQREEKLARQSASFEERTADIAKQQEQLNNLQKIAERQPYSNEAKQIPGLQQRIRLQQQDLDLEKEIAGINEERYKHNLTDPEADRRIELAKRRNLALQVGSELDYKAATTDQERKQKKRDLDAEITAQNELTDSLKGQLEFYTKKAETNPYSPEALDIPNLQKEIALREANVSLVRELADIDEKKFTTNSPQGNAESEASIQAAKQKNEQTKETIRLTYEQAKADQKLKISKRDLEAYSAQANISSQVVTARVSQFDTQQSKTPFSYDSGTYSALQVKRFQAQSNVENFNLQSQIADAEELARTHQRTREETDLYIASLRQLNSISLNGLRDEINKSIGENQINQLTKVKDNLQTVFDLTKSNSINLSNARADAYLAAGGNEFVANASKRRTGRETELQRRDQELRSYDISVLSSRLKGIEIDDDTITKAKSDIVAISELNLANLNNQFKTFGSNLTSIAQQGLQGLSSGIADLIVKGGSLTDVFDNLFDTILTGVINSGLNSLIGGLTSGLFGGQPQKQSSSDGGLFGFIGNIFSGGGIGSLLGGLFSAGGMIPNYANGGLMEAIVTSAIKERQQSGKQPRLIMGHVGELLINADRVKELKNLGVTSQLLLGKANYADGGIVDSETYPSREFGRGIGTSNSRKNELTIHYQSKQIAGENYVTEDQFQQGMRKAAEEGGKRGAQIVTNKLGNSPGYRRSVGL